MAKFLRRAFPVARASTITRANIGRFKELWAEEHDKAPTPERFLDYVMPGSHTTRYTRRHVARAYRLMANKLAQETT